MPPPESVRISTRRRSLRGSCASASRVTSMWSAAVFEPAFPGRSRTASASPARRRRDRRRQSAGDGHRSSSTSAAACSFSEQAVTIVASMSTVTRPPSAPGAAPPGQFPGPRPGGGPGCADGLQRPRRIAGQAGHQPGDHRIRSHRPEQSGSARSTATSARQSPPSASATARSVTIFPGSVHRPRRPPPFQRPRQALVQARDPQRRASSRPPAWDTSSGAVSGHRDLGAAGGKMHAESAFRTGRNRTLRQALFFQVKGTFRI